MVSDREPRYQLLDSNGTVVGSLYEKSNGKLALQDGNTDTEVVFDGDTIGSGSESLDIDSLASGLKVLDLVDSVSGNTVYDSSAEKLGDGNQNADINDLLVSDVQADSVSTGETHTETIGANQYRFAGDYNGADPDARLDDALSAANRFNVIYLEAGVYSNNRTIATEHTFIGTSQGRASDATQITGSWTLDARVLIKQISGGGSLTFNANYSTLTQSSPTASASITAAADGFRYVNNVFGDVTFQSGTTNGLVDGCVLTTVTDNGSNTVGDIA